ncbi:expressed unknown protein [Seminavis robusta]|uniref:Uncharacterized protein n=1 Tax=Seminavis robusta TaxID=568900 RepID=A0A9N8EUU1_9STRA|nr:expressed unknown protein [Seminavis robusta]|eukprot:Sro1753_g295410.1 n/a (244) ;mRNA; r:6878-7722
MSVFPLPRITKRKKILCSKETLIKIYLIPILVLIIAFQLFPETSQAFHHTLETLSLSQYTGELSEEIRPLINGPITLTISILFGSLVNKHDHFHTLPTTVSTSSSRNCPSQRLPASSVFGRRIARTRKESSQNAISQQPQEPGGANYGLVLGELYAAIANLKQHKIEFMAAVQKNFTPAHYANLLTQAFALLIIYLWETDNVALIEAHPFELRAAWAILMSTMASLVAVIIDLNTHPFPTLSS